MAKRLPVFKTPISTYPHTANLAAFLWSKEKVFPWLMNYFIKPHGWQVSGMDYNMDYEDFYIIDCPAVLYERINIHVLRSGWKDAVQFIKEMLELNYYAYLVVDTSKISAYGWSCYHDMFIYGYDDGLKIFFAADCFRNGRYSFEEIPYEELRRAIPYGQKGYKNIFEFHDDVILLRENPDFTMGFQPSRVRESLEDYIKAVPGQYTFSRLKLGYPEEIAKYVFGRDCYKIIYNHLDYSIEHDILLPHSIRVFHLAYEMKAVMCERLQFMIEKDYIRNGERYKQIYSELGKMAFLCQNLYIKYDITGKKDLLYKIYENMKLVEKLEIECMCNMAEDIVCLKSC